MGGQKLIWGGGICPPLPPPGAATEECSKPPDRTNDIYMSVDSYPKHKDLPCELSWDVELL